MLAAEGLLRLAISESLVVGVNLNDARAAMATWLKRISVDMNMEVSIEAKIFDTTEEIVRRARGAEVDALALNVLEYRLISDVLDSSQVVAESDRAAFQQYCLLTKRSSGIRGIRDLLGRRLFQLQGGRMAVARAWIATLLDEAHLPPAQEFFQSITLDSKPSRVILPVFFGQADACLTSRQSFETMCELNPQVGKDLEVILSAPPMVVTFHVFHKNYHGANREKFGAVFANLMGSAAGRQLGALFQFDRLVVRDSSCLAPALKILEAAERIKAKSKGVARKT